MTNIIDVKPRYQIKAHDVLGSGDKVVIYHNVGTIKLVLNLPSHFFQFEEFQMILYEKLMENEHLVGPKIVSTHSNRPFIINSRPLKNVAPPRGQGNTQVHLW